MILKEWLDARWQLLIMVALVLLSVPLTTPLGTTARIATIDGIDVAVDELHEYFSWGGVPLALLAALLGANMISTEVSRGSILLILSRPVSRIRILLTKYTVCAVTLLGAAAFGHVLLLAIAAKSYPLGAVSAVGVAISTVLLWLGSLLVLGVALIFSIVLSKALPAFVAAVVSVYLLFYWVPAYIVESLPREVRNRPLHDPGAPEWEQVMLSVVLEEKLSLASYWTKVGLYEGSTLAGLDLTVCLIAATMPLLAALWLFNRKAY